MCLSTPKMPPPPPPPPPPQEVKLADMNTVRRKQNSNSAPIAGGTLLTGPSGVQNSQLNIGGSTLLGG